MVCATTSTLLSWLAASGGTTSGVRIAPSAACGGGLGMFATRELTPSEVLCSVPLQACISAADACADPVIGPAVLDYLDESEEYGQQKGAEFVALVAMLVHARYGGTEAAEARERYGTFVDSMPWGDSGDDSLRHHPLLRRRGDEPQEASEAQAAAVTRARKMAGGTARMAAELLGAGNNEQLVARCFRATIIVASRTFDFAPSWRRLQGAEGVRWRGKMLVPALDFLNHPSRSALAHDASTAQTAFFAQEHAIVDACAAHTLHLGDDGEDVEVRLLAPAKLRVPEGEELFAWYSNAGWGSQTREEWDAAAAAFYTQYGFSPWE